MNRIHAAVVAFVLALPAAVFADEPKTEWQKAQEAFAQAIEKGHASTVALKIKATWNDPKTPVMIQPGQASNPNYTVRPKTHSSGVLIDAEGHILTSYFNVDGKIDRIEVVLADGTKTPGSLVGWDQAKDLALLKVDPKGLTLKPIAWARGDLHVGAFVFALGRSPEPASPTATRGIVSTVDRVELQVTGIVEQTIQFDAKTNYGNSGGALVNVRGELVGVVGHVRLQSPWGQNSGVSFATPVWKIREVLDQLKAGEKITKPKSPFLGVGPAEGSTGGVVIANVQPNSGASRAGLVPGDVITGIDGTKVQNWAEFVAVIRKRKPGDTIKLDVRRGDEEIVIDATLGERPN
ncbi:MAG: trypsin-like peptidase domain-containing protein [Candidatus Brocadiae bacterium]|nr:trypsin-like peptidase domain-containing protein [Candidatus Brocadiia bacterium]